MFLKEVKQLSKKKNIQLNSLLPHSKNYICLTKILLICDDNEHKRASKYT